MTMRARRHGWIAGNGAAGVLLVLLVTAAACGSDGADGPGTGAAPTTEVSPGDDPGPEPAEQPIETEAATIVVNTGCWEIWYERGEARYRSRDFPDDWAPGTEKTGTMGFVSETEAIFEADDGSGTATFVGGPDAVFTLDCPGYDTPDIPAP